MGSCRLQDGKVVTKVAGDNFSIAVYKLGDTYYGARSNEFGYANYQILPKGPANVVEMHKDEVEEEDKTTPAHEEQN